MTQIDVDSEAEAPVLLFAATTGLMVIQASTAIIVNPDLDDLTDNGDGVTLAANTVYQFPVVGEALYATAAADSAVQVIKL